MGDLPHGWTLARLGEIADEPEQHVPQGDESFVYIDIGAIDRNSKTIRSPQRMLGKDAPSRARKRVETGDTLVSMTRPNLNAVALVPEPLDGQIASTGFDVLRPRSGIDPRWLAYTVRADGFITAMSALVQGALYPAVRAKDVRSYVAPLAPQAEQTQIADQLDTLMSRIQACKDRLDAIPALLKRFRQAVLNSGVRGEFIEARQLEDKPQWSETTIGAIAIDLRYGTSKKCSYSAEGYGVLRIPNIALHGRIEVGDLKRADFDTGEVQKLALRDGDLLVIRSNGSLDLVGACSVVTQKEVGLLFAGYLMRLRVDPMKARPAYVRMCLSTTAQRGLIEQTAKSTSGVNNLNSEELRSLPLRLPQLHEQDEIIHRVQLLFEHADRIDALHAAAIAQSQRLAPLTLAKGFRGELVPQDPNDEPASALLARIAALRATPVAEPKVRQPRLPRAPRAPKEHFAMTKSRQDDDVIGHPYLADHLRRLGTSATAEALFKVAELPVADFYKQLAWEVAQGHVKDNQTSLEPGHAAE